MKKGLTALISGVIFTANFNAAYAQTNGVDEDIFPSKKWNICNETSYVLRVAVATLVDGAMTPRGWERVRPGACLTQSPPAGTDRYVYAESEKFSHRPRKGMERQCEAVRFRC